MKDSPATSSGETGAAPGPTHVSRRAPRETALRSYDRGREDEREATIELLEELAEQVGDAVAAAYLDGRHEAGEDLSEFDSTRARRARQLRRYGRTEMRNAAMRFQLAELQRRWPVGSG